MKPGRPRVSFWLIIDVNWLKRYVGPPVYGSSNEW